MKILILGSSGLLGRKIYSYLKIKKLDIIHNGLRKRILDLEKINNLKILLKNNPDIIINAAAETDINICEEFSKKSSKINVNLAQNLFLLKKKLNLKFKVIFFSTDQIYNSKKFSKENDNISIINNYSYQKVMAEKIYLNNKSIIFRTNFFGKGIGNKKSFSDWVYSCFKSGKKFPLFKDIVFNPLRIDTLCLVIYRIIRDKKIDNYGLYNLGSKGSISKSNFAILFAKKVGIYNNLYFLCNSSSILKVKRPKNMTMNIKKFEKSYNIKLPNIKNEIINESKKYINAKI